MKENIKELRQKYPAGTAVELICMQDDPRPVPAGTKGIVTHVDAAGTIHVRWDNGSGLGLIPGVDKYRIICPITVSLERIKDDLAAEGAWCSHAYGIECFTPMKEYKALKVFLQALGVDSTLKIAEEAALQELSNMKADGRSFLNERHVKKLEDADRLFVAALRKATKEAEELLSIVEVSA